MLELSRFDFHNFRNCSKPNITIVQDALLGTYLMSRGIDRLKRREFFDITLSAYKTLEGSEDYMGKRTEIQGVWDQDRMQEILEVTQEFNKKEKKNEEEDNYCIYNGRSLISLLLPKDFIFEKKNNASLFVFF